MHPLRAAFATALLGALAACTSDPGLGTRKEHDTVRACPEAVYTDARGIPRSVSTRQIRHCFPGEPFCFCDRDNDCWATGRCVRRTWVE